MPLKVYLIIVVFIIHLALSNTVYASEIWPQFSSISLLDYQSLHGPEFIDSEYSSDILTFRKPIHWDYSHMRSENYFDTSVGSLSGKRFLIQNRLTLTKNLNKKLDFKIFHLRDSDFEKNNSHFIFEFPFKLNSLWQFSIYGETLTFKSEDDFGISLSHFFSSQKLIKIYYTASDFSRNDRNESDDHFNHSPQKWGIHHKSIRSKSEFLQFDSYYEPHIIWSFPQNNNDFHYEKVFAQIKWLKQFKPYTLNVNSSYVKRTKKFQTNNTYSSGWDFENIDLLIELQNYKYNYGIYFVDRKWESPNGGIHQLDSLPYFWHTILRGLQYKLDSGYELTWHRSIGPEVLKSNTDKDVAIESRWNLKYVIFFKENSEMNILFTFDLDEFGSESTWEGGNVQFKTDF